MIKVKTYFRELFWGWCQENDIICEYMGTSSHDRTDTWYIGNERDRMCAILRWSDA
jgi:hypothetical protein